MAACAVAAVGCAEASSGSVSSADTGAPPSGDVVEPTDTLGSSDLVEAVDVVQGSDNNTDLAQPLDVAGPDARAELDVPDFPKAPGSLGGDRPASYVLPDDYDPKKSWPVMLVLHGYGASGFIQDAYLGISAEARTRGVIVILPDGTVDTEGSQFWNGTDACCDFGKTGVDDVAYLTGLLDEAATYFNIDASRTYSLGHSNGAFMSYRLACEHGDRFAGIVALAGLMWKDGGKCPDTGKVGVLQVHGTDDDTIPYLGKLNMPTALDSAAFWATRNGCAAKTTALETLDLDTQVAGSETKVEVFDGCPDGAAAALWTLQGGSHIPSFSGLFAEKALDFLLAQRQQ
jgi:polyhydroxybutyrate depolymerase